MWRWALALLLTAAPARAADLAAARSEHFEIWSEVGPEAATATATRLEELRADLQVLGIAPPEQVLRVLLLERGGAALPHDASRRRTMERSQGVSVRGPDLRAILVGWNEPGDPLVAVGHEFAHQVDELSRREYPLYLREGLAELTGRIERGEGMLRLGEPAVAHLQRLDGHAWIAWEDVAGAQPGDAAYGAQTFYAQSWLVTHWLVSRSSLNAVDPDALEQAMKELGRDGVTVALRAHLAGLTALDSRERLPAGATVTTSALGGWAIPSAMAEIRSRISADGGIEQELEELAERFPLQPEPAVALGRFYLQKDDQTQAFAWLTRASKQGLADPHAWYQLGLLQMSPGREASGSAVAAMGWAHRLQPGEARYALGYAQAATAAGLYPEAESALLPLLTDVAWGPRAQQELEYMQRRRLGEMALAPRPEIAIARPEQPAPLPPVRHGKLAEPGPQPKPRRKWPPPGSILLAGRITFVTCTEEGKRVTLRTARSKRVFLVPAGRAPSLYRAPADARELPCGPARWSVNLAYRPDRSRRGIAGIVTGIVF